MVIQTTGGSANGYMTGERELKRKPRDKPGRLSDLFAFGFAPFLGLGFLCIFVFLGLGFLSFSRCIDASSATNARPIADAMCTYIYTRVLARGVASRRLRFE